MEEGQAVTWVLSGSLWLCVEKRQLAVDGGVERESREKATATVYVGQDGGLAWGMAVEKGRRGPI